MSKTEAGLPLFMAVGAILPSENRAIHCTLDRAMPVTGQDHMIVAIEAVLGIKVIKSRHPPFLSQSAVLSGIFAGIPRDSVKTLGATDR